MSMFMAAVLPIAAAREVDEFIDSELADSRNPNRQPKTPLDDGGAFVLHRLAASLYARGYADGELAAADRARAQHRRERDAASETP